MARKDWPLEMTSKIPVLTNKLALSYVHRQENSLSFNAN